MKTTNRKVVRSNPTQSLSDIKENTEQNSILQDSMPKRQGLEPFKTVTSIHMSQKTLRK